MRLGLLTFHRAHNYGAILQAYALKTYLESCGHFVDFIDYMPTWHSAVYKVWNNEFYKKKTIFGKIKYIIFWLFSCRRRIKRYNNFQNFITQYLKLLPKAKYTHIPIHLKTNYDYIVVGSDQIWRNWVVEGRYVGFDPIYFGEGIFPRQKYISYAASMGIINYTAEEELFLRESLRHFDNISVRETNLQEELIKWGYNASIVADPTFLLRKEQWNGLLPQKRYTNRKYALFYRLLASDAARVLAEQIATELNLALLVINASISVKSRENETQVASPIEFLHMLRDSEFVISTSFHGTVFSIIFEKPFYTLGLGRNDGRVKSLLYKLGLEDRYLSAGDNFEDVKITKPSFDVEKLVKYISDSKAYLEKGLK